MRLNRAMPEKLHYLADEDIVPFTIIFEQKADRCQA